MSYWTGDAMKVGTVEQLLIDDHIVEDAWDLERRVCRPLRHPIGPVLLADRPWEDGMRYANVLYDERDGLYRMLYAVVNFEAYQYQYVAGLPERWDRAKHGTPKFFCYAESPDGLHWEKPAFDFASWRNHERTNVVMPGHARAQQAFVFWNPDQSDERRRLIAFYRDVYNWGKPDQRDGRCLAYSPDGVHWTEDPGNPVTQSASDGDNPVCWDPATRQWFCFIRPRMLTFDQRATPRPSVGNNKRRMAVITSPDLREWTFPRTVMYPDELDVTTMSIDMWTVFKHGSHFIALVSILDETRKGIREVRIASSADGFRWSRLPHRPTFFERGPEGSFDGGSVMFCGEPVGMGDRWLLYYLGMNPGVLGESFYVDAIGVAVLPRGRLVGRFAGDRDRFLLTREVTVGGKHLDVHCEAVHDRIGRPECEIRVGIARRARQASDHRDMGYYEGFGIDDCDPIRSTNAALRVTWKGNDDLSSLVGKPAYLRFYLRNAGIYSFRFAGD